MLSLGAGRAASVVAATVAHLALGCGGGAGGAGESGDPPDGSAADGDDVRDGATDAPDDGAVVPMGRPMVYVGGYEPTLRWYAFDRTTGALDPAGSLEVDGAPSFLAIDNARFRLFALNEWDTAVQAFDIHPVTGDLTPRNTVSSGGAGPAHVAVHPSGNWVMVANYTAGSVRVIAVEADGSLGEASDTVMSGAQAHQILADADGTHVVVPCKGADRIQQYAFSTANGTLTALSPAYVATGVGAGPRHAAYHPTLPRLYAIHELSNEMSVYAVDGMGRLTELDTQGTLPGSFGGANTTAEVVVHPSGRWLYGSNRGHDSIVRYALDAGTGAMTLADHTSTEGETPRSFAVDPWGEYLVVANQDSDSLVVLRVAAGTGALTDTGERASPPSPAFVGFALLEP